MKILAVYACRTYLVLPVVFSIHTERLAEISLHCLCCTIVSHNFQNIYIFSILRVLSHADVDIILKTFFSNIPMYSKTLYVSDVTM